MPLIEVDADEFAQLNAEYKAALLRLNHALAQNASLADRLAEAIKGIDAHRIALELRAVEAEEQAKSLLITLERTTELALTHESAANRYSSRLGSIQTALSDVLVRNQDAKVSNADAMSELHEHFYQWFQAGIVERHLHTFRADGTCECGASPIPEPNEPAVERGVLETTCGKCGGYVEIDAYGTRRHLCG